LRIALLSLALAALLPASAARRLPATHPSAFRVGDLSAAASFRDGTLRSARSARALRQGSWGGPIKAADGEVVTVYVSDSYPVDPALPQSVADFLTQLYHGSELSTVRIYLAPLREVQALCGPGTSGCADGQGQIVATGDPLPDGTSAANVLAHEYGHHVAASRENPPWNALDWGPKRWATSASVCARTAAGTAFPGDEGANYRLNPGEGWAEVYRLANFLRQAWPGWILTDWKIVDESFYPNAIQLEAAKADALQPWKGPRKRTWSGRFRNVAPKGRPARVPRVRTAISTPLDGDLTVRLRRAPAGTTMSLSTPAGKIVVPGAHYVVSTNVCGRRVFVLTIRSKRPGRFSYSISTP
jgi:hypothetical protein